MLLKAIMIAAVWEQSFLDPTSTLDIAANAAFPLSEFTHPICAVLQSYVCPSMPFLYGYYKIFVINFALVLSRLLCILFLYQTPVVNSFD